MAIKKILENTKSKIILAVKDKSNPIYKLSPYESIKLLEVGKTKNVIDTIEKSLSYVTTDYCLINPITTIPNDTELLLPFIEYGLNPIPRRIGLQLLLIIKL